MVNLGKSPFDDASGSQLLSYLAQQGVLAGVTTAAPAGTTIDDATPISGGVVIGDGALNAGYRLPDGVIGTHILAYSITNNAKIYPPNSSSKINGGGAGAADTLTAGTPTQYLKYSDTEWVSF